MAWQDRVREGAYTSATSRTRTVFDFENVSQEVDKRTSLFEFPDAPGTYVQDLGRSGRQYPLRLFFWGDDHDLEAEAFIETLLETGPGTLEHPFYGRKLVVPFGKIRGRDDLKTAANQTVIEVIFWETIADVYPLVQQDPASEAQSALDAFFTAAATQFSQVLGLDSESERATFQARYESVKATATSGLAAVAATQAEVKEKFDTINSSIDQSIDILIDEPLQLGFQTLQLIAAPGNAATLVQNRLDAYQNLLATILNTETETPGNDATNSNTFQNNNLYGAGYISGMLTSVLNNEFVTKTNALEAADFILDEFENWIEWHDDNYTSLEEIDTGELYQALKSAVGITTGFLVGISFSLKQERSFILQNSRGVLDLVTQLYGDPDEQLDFFINSNNLTGDEIIELPAGKTIVYYV